MVMSIPLLEQAARALETTLVDTIQIMDVGEKKTVGIDVTRDLTPVGDPVPGLVQQTNLANAVESRTDTTWSVKTSLRTSFTSGQAVKVISSVADPTLNGKVLLLDKVSQGGVLRKGVASTFDTVNQEGKEGL